MHYSSSKQVDTLGSKFVSQWVPRQLDKKSASENLVDIYLCFDMAKCKSLWIYGPLSTEKKGRKKEDCF